MRLVLLLLLCACASRGFNRAALRNDLNATEVVTDADVARALAKAPQLPRPFRLGVYFDEPRSHRAPAGWRWTEENRKKVLSAAEGWMGAGEVSDVFPITDLVVTGTDLKSLRLAAARHGADALLVVSGVSDLDQHSNPLVFTYVAVLPMLFVPGSVADSLFIARAAMWDVRNEYLYLAAESEQAKSQTRPVAFLDEQALTDDAKDGAVTQLAEELSRRLAGFAKRTR